MRSQCVCVSLFARRRVCALVAVRSLVTHLAIASLAIFSAFLRLEALQRAGLTTTRHTESRWIAVTVGYALTAPWQDLTTMTANSSTKGAQPSA